jgi:RNase P subunit RPR2
VEADLAGRMVYSRPLEDDMREATCAACDYPLDANAIKVTIAGKTVEVCCDECAQKLKEAHASATAAKRA